MSIYLSIVIPFYNEEESVQALIDSVKKTCVGSEYSYEIILVDDGSKDNTWCLIENAAQTSRETTGIRLRKNCGQTAAMVAGISYSTGDIIVTMDGDLQNDPADIPALLEKIEQGYDIVSGWRKYRKDHFSRVLPSRIANWIISITTGVHLHDYGCSLKAYRADCIKTLEAYGEMHRFFPAVASMTGARVTELPVNHYPRNFGVSKYGFERVFKVLADIVSINLIIRFSSMPLKGFSIFALPFVLLALFSFFTGGVAFVFNWTAGKAAFFGFIGFFSFMTAVHLLILGMLGELIVNTSDLSFTKMPEITKKNLN
ncbi:MAG: glycosyltransferase family 2 protein [Deltaproteobacteria bacterium]|jgi:glycosyltransferase involved in cell wall biosynthesis|nr:glycosyltransferase family 2 protein [Deltaproteobacteria bacterium]